MDLESVEEPGLLLRTTWRHLLPSVEYDLIANASRSDIPFCYINQAASGLAAW